MNFFFLSKVWGRAGAVGSRAVWLEMSSHSEKTCWGHVRASLSKYHIVTLSPPEISPVCSSPVWVVRQIHWPPHFQGTYPAQVILPEISWNLICLSFGKFWGGHYWPLGILFLRCHVVVFRSQAAWRVYLCNNAYQIRPSWPGMARVCSVCVRACTWKCCRQWEAGLSRECFLFVKLKFKVGESEEQMKTKNKSPK